MEDSILISSPLIDRLRKCSNEEPILYSKEEKIYASEIYRRSAMLAVNLYESGLRRDDRTVIAIEPGVDFLLIVYANMLLRTQLTIIDPEMGQELYNQKVSQWNPGWAFVDSRLLFLNEHPTINSLVRRFAKKNVYFPEIDDVKLIAVGGGLPVKRAFASLRQISTLENRIPAVTDEGTNHDFLVTYTSGTTSVPKGVLHSLNGLELSFQHIVKLLDSPMGQRLANHLPHFMLIGINAGIPVYLWDYDAGAAKKIRFLEKHKITTLFGPPSDYLELINYCKERRRNLPACLTHVIIGSAPVYKGFLTLLTNYLPEHTRISAFYGMTENLVVAHIDGREKLLDQSNGDPVGKPVAGVEIQIAEDGEILLRSDQLFSRYWHQTKRPDWHSTGDLGYINDQGCLVLTGRKKDMILRRNQNIYPGLYEPTIHRIPGVSAAAMIGIYSETLFDEEVYLIIESNEQLSEVWVMDLLRKGQYSIDKEALPDYIKFMKLPRKGRQMKIDKELLRQTFSK